MCFMPKAEVSDMRVVVSRFGFTKPKQWRTLLDKLKARQMLACATDQAVIYLTPGILITEQVVKILSESGFEACRIS
jgi:hypothetical protein